MSNTLMRDLCCIATAALLAAACGGTDIISAQSLGAVVTVVDSGPALRSARTFVLPDTVIRLSLTGDAIGPVLAHELVADIRAHFVSLGWLEIREEPVSRPDVVVLVAASTRVQTGVLYSDWFAAWGYLPYWGSSVNSTWTWGFSGDVVPYTYQAGTLLVTMIDVRAPRDDAKTIPMLWAAALDGLVGDASTMVRLHAGIDQAFEQSPYLRLN